MISILTGGYTVDEVERLALLLSKMSNELCEDVDSICANCTNSTLCRDLCSSYEHLLNVLDNPKAYSTRKGHRKHKGDLH